MACVNSGHGSGGGDSSGWTGSGLGGDPGPMRSRSCIESASIARSERGFTQPRMWRQFLAWRRQPQESRTEPTIILSPKRSVHMY
jgi:hypothetical protein